MGPAHWILLACGVAGVLVVTVHNRRRIERMRQGR